MPMQEYDIDDKYFKKIRKLALLTSASSVATFVLVCLLIAVGIGFEYAIPLILMVLSQFVYPLYFIIRLWNIRYEDILSDENGLWYKYQSKEIGLVRWASIHKLKGNFLIGRVNLLGADDEMLLGVSHHLNGFEQLRERLFEQVKPNYKDALPNYFLSGFAHHIVYAVVVTAFLLSGSIAVWYNSTLEPEFSVLSVIYIVTTLCIIGTIGLYLFSICHISITDNQLVINRPIKKQYINFSDIESVNLVDNCSGPKRVTVVSITTSDKKIVQIKWFQKDYHIFYLTLLNAIECCKSVV